MSGAISEWGFPKKSSKSYQKIKAYVQIRIMNPALDFLAFD
jgi:hypothetical protein